MVYLVCLFMKTHLLVLLQHNCLDLVHCAFSCKLSACVRNITAFCKYLLTTEGDNISHFEQLQYIDKTQISADI